MAKKAEKTVEKDPSDIIVRGSCGNRGRARAEQLCETHCREANPDGNRSGGVGGNGLHPCSGLRSQAGRLPNAYAGGSAEAGRGALQTGSGTQTADERRPQPDGL